MAEENGFGGGRGGRARALAAISSAASHLEEVLEQSAFVPPVHLARHLVVAREHLVPGGVRQRDVLGVRRAQVHLRMLLPPSRQKFRVGSVC